MLPVAFQLGYPARFPFGSAASEGGLRSWLAVRWTCTAALYLTAPPSCGRSAADGRRNDFRDWRLDRLP